MRILSATICAALLLISSSADATCTFGFLTPVPYEANAKPGDVTTGDFNHDGYVDVAVVNRTELKISILLGAAGGVLGNPSTIPIERSQGDIQAGHFNDDNHLDLVVAMQWSNDFTAYPHLKVLLGNGNGTFTPVAYTEQQLVWQNPTDIALGDFNKDGKTDAVTAKDSADWSSMQNVGGKFAQKASYDTGSGVAHGIAVGDFDGDGHADVALSEAVNKKVFTYYGVGDGTFTAGATTLEFPHAQRQPFDVESGDFNGDGKDDLAVVFYNPYSSDITAPLKIALSNGAARTFATPTDSAEVMSSQELLVHDMDGDGKKDVVVASFGGLVVFRGNGDGTFAATQPFGTDTEWPLGIAIDDFDRDGGPDVVGTMFTAGKVKVFLNSCGRIGLNLSSSANPAAQGTPITITGTVVPPPAVAPTGTLTLKRGGTTLNTGNLTGGNSLQATMNDLTPATYTITAEYSGDSRFIPSTKTLLQQVTPPPFGPPPGVNAISTGGPVQVAWIGTANTDHYEVWRNNGAGWAFVGNAPNASFSDATAPSNAALLYRVRAIAPGGSASDYSAADLALTYAFTDPTLTPGVTKIKRAHLNELRNAANAVRALASLGAATWGEATPSRVRASHVTELRNAIAAARTNLGLSTATYTDPTLTALKIKAIHFEQLRSAMR